MTENRGLKGYRCQKCNWADFFETKTCPRCHNEIEQMSSSGKGRLETFTVIRYPPEGFETEAPYVVGLIDLEEGFRVIGRVKANLDDLQVSKTVHFLRKEGAVLHFSV